MRDKDVYRLLKRNCEKPDQIRKDTFIRSVNSAHRKRKMSFPDMLMIQSRYIRKYHWVISVLMILLFLVVFTKLKDDTILYLSNMIPLLAGLGMLEVLKADMCGMSELERTALISGKGALFAKMTVIGIMHLCTILVLAALMLSISGSGFILTAVRLLIPYLTTTILCMEMERTSFGRENSWYLLGVPLLVMTLRNLIYHTGIVYSVHTGLLVVLAAVLLGIQMYEIKKMIRMEEYVWN